MGVDRGNTVSIPAPTDAIKDATRVTIHWQQNFSQRDATYYSLAGVNKNQGDAPVYVFIEAEWYNDTHLSQVGTKHGDTFELHIDDKFQYGQKSGDGAKRFVVYHDKGRKPYQHRFIETALGSAAAGAAQKLAGFFGYGNVADMAKSVASAFVGDYLKTF